MKRQNSIKTVLLALFCLTILAAGQAMAQTTMEANYQWAAPSTGSTVAHYVVQLSSDGGATWTTLGTTDTNTYAVNLTVGVSHQIRVAGVDAEGRQGVFSDPSEPYTPDPGAPGKPGKPILF